MNGWGHNRRWGVSPHTSSIGSRIALTNTLMVLTAGHGEGVLTIGNDDKARFFTGQKFLDDHPAPGLSKGVPR